MQADQDKAKAVGHIPSGLFIICTHENGQKHGFLASWVQQASFEPLLVTFGMQPDRPAHSAITSGKTFTINIVGEHETQYLRHFWTGYEESPFGEIPHDLSENGGILMTGAKSTLECKCKKTFHPGDHEIIAAEVIGSYVHNDDSKPKVHIRKTGISY